MQQLISELFENHNNAQRTIREDLNPNSSSLDPIDFVKLMSMTTPQQYGVRIQNYFRDRYSLCNSSGSDSGDWEENIEVKTSIVKDGKINLVQIRPWQPIEFYVNIGIELAPRVSISVLHVPATEVYKINMEAAHGSKKVVRENKFSERRVTLEWDGQIMKFFRNTYMYEFIQ